MDRLKIRPSCSFVFLGHPLYHTPQNEYRSKMISVQQSVCSICLLTESVVRNESREEKKGRKIKEARNRRETSLLLTSATV